MDEAALNRKAVKRIMAVITAGVLLLLFDLLVGFDFSTLKLMNSGGSMYLVRPVEGSSAGHISLKADIETENGTVTKDYELSLYPYARENSSRAGSGSSGSGGKAGASGIAGSMSEEELLAYEMRSVINPPRPPENRRKNNMVCRKADQHSRYCFCNDSARGVHIQKPV